MGRARSIRTGYEQSRPPDATSRAHSFGDRVHPSTAMKWLYAVERLALRAVAPRRAARRLRPTEAGSDSGRPLCAGGLVAARPLPPPNGHAIAVSGCALGDRAHWRYTTRLRSQRESAGSAGILPASSHRQGKAAGRQDAGAPSTRPLRPPGWYCSNAPSWSGPFTLSLRVEKGYESLVP